MAYLIRGVVRDSSGSPIPEARAYFVGGPEPFPDIAALTDEDGAFTLSAPAPGAYRIECAAEGFSSRLTAVDVGEGEETHFEIRLTPT
jgi:Carboxypeptidase regulatory-like domain